MREGIIGQLRIQSLVGLRNSRSQIGMTEAGALVGTQSLSRRGEIDPDFKTVGTLDQMKVSAIEIDDRLVIHLPVHAGKTGLHIFTENALYRMLCPPAKQQAGIADQFELKQPL